MGNLPPIVNLGIGYMTLWGLFQLFCVSGQRVLGFITIVMILGVIGVISKLG